MSFKLSRGMGYKRKRDASKFQKDMNWLFKPQLMKRQRRFVPGADRTGGYYGRFAYGSREQRGELKFHDVDLDDAVVATGGSVTASVNLIPQGITEVTRVGRKATIKSFNWRYSITMPEIDAAATAEVPDAVRVIVFVDKQCNGATAAVTDILETANWQSFRNLSNSNRFYILLDKVHVTNYNTLASDNAGVVSQAKMQKDLSFYKKCSIPLEFDAATGAITEIRSNNFGVLLISTQGKIGFTSKIRLRFSDN